MNRQVLKFEPNQPQTVALEFPDGLNVQGFGGPQVKFSLTDQRVLYADPELAQAIRTLGVQPGEVFTITKRRETGKRPWWDLERVKQPSQAVRPVSGPEIPHPSVEIQPAHPQPGKTAIPATVPPRKPAQVEHMDAPPARGVTLTKTPPLKPTYEQAFRESLRIVTEGLREAGEQWSDSAKQAMVSTLMIQLGRENRLGAFQPQVTKVA